jgi:hypothetical protein
VDLTISPTVALLLELDDDMMADTFGPNRNAITFAMPNETETPCSSCWTSTCAANKYIKGIVMSAKNTKM